MAKGELRVRAAAHKCATDDGIELRLPLAPSAHTVDDHGCVLAKPNHLCVGDLAFLATARTVTGGA